MPVTTSKRTTKQGRNTGPDAGAKVEKGSKAAPSTSTIIRKMKIVAQKMLAGQGLA
jgi:hypothetical protein